MTVPGIVAAVPLPTWIKDMVLLFLLLVGLFRTGKTVLWVWHTVRNFFSSLYARIMWQDLLRLESNDGVRLINIWNEGKLDISDIRAFIWDVESKQQMLFCRDSPEKPITLKKGECERMMLFELRDSFTTTTLVFIFYPVLGWRKQWVGVCVPPVGYLSYYRSDFEEFGKGLGEPSALAKKVRWLPRKVRQYINEKGCETGFVPSPLSPYVRMENEEHMGKAWEQIPALVNKLHQELDPVRLERAEKTLRERQEEADRPRREKIFAQIGKRQEKICQHSS